MVMKDRIKELRRVPASELRANPKNWRRHPPAQEAALRGVLDEIGFADALIARETDDGLELIDGHLRQEVMGDQPVPVLVLDVTEDEADKLLLTLDPLAMMAHADTDQLLELLRDNPFESQAVADMLEALVNGERLPMPDLTEPMEDPGPQIDRADELREKWQTERGQIWEVGRHRLMCGDSTDPDDCTRLLSAATLQLILTDPPYGVAYDGSGKNPRWRSDGAVITNDDLGVGQEQFWYEAIRHWPLDGDAYVFAAAGPLNMALAKAMESAGITQHQWIIWVKDRFTLGRSHFHYRHEHIFYGWKGNSSWQGSRTVDSVWEVARPHASPEHPTMKPVELLRPAVENSSERSGLIGDPFTGAGATMVAAEQLGRICYGMEIEPKYVAVTLERMAGMGLEPHLSAL